MFSHPNDEIHGIEFENEEISIFIGRPITDVERFKIFFINKNDER